MNHLALYREFRPKTFDEVIGQDQIVKTLRNQIKTESFGHAYLFCGTRGTGKTSIAKIFSKAINCENNQNGNPCGNCESCAGGENLDIIEIDAASNNGVDKIRELRENIKFLPLKSKFKVYIIDEVHMLSEGAFNALLKTLEEPPSHAIFILATTEVQKLPQTILSRCTRFDFKLVSKEDLRKQLKNIFEKIGATADEESLDIIVSAAEGSVRDCLSIADRCVSFCEGKLTGEKVLEVLGGVSKELIINLTDYIVNGDMENSVASLTKMLDDGKSVNNLLKELLTIFKDLTLIKTCTENAASNLISFPKPYFSRLRAIAENLDKQKAESCLDVLSALEAQIKTSTMNNLLLSACVVKLVLICLKERNNGPLKERSFNKSVIEATPLNIKTEENYKVEEQDDAPKKKLI